MKKRSTKSYSTEMCEFLCSTRPKTTSVLTFSDSRYGPQKQTGPVERWPSLLCGLRCLIDLNFWIETYVWIIPSGIAKDCMAVLSTNGYSAYFPAFEQTREMFTEMVTLPRRRILVYHIQTNFYEKGS